MANITITIPDQKVEEVTNTLASAFGYRDELEDEAGEVISNPQSKGAFVKEIMVRFLRDHYRMRKEWEAREAMTVEEEADNYTSDITVN